MDENPKQYKDINVRFIVLCLFILVILAGFFWIFKSNVQKEVGRYQFYVKDNNAFAYVYVFDTKTSRIFLRSIFSRNSETRNLLIFGFPENESTCLDLGTINHPIIPHTQKYIAKQNRWKNNPIVTKAPKDIFDQIEAQSQTESITPEQANRELLRGAAARELERRSELTELKKKGVRPDGTEPDHP